MPQRRILMIVGDFTEDYETMVPFQALAAVGHVVDAVCPGKSAGDFVATAIHDFEGLQNYTEKRGHNFQLTADFSSVDADRYDALVIPGGRAPEYLRYEAGVIDLVRSFFAADKPVACICHGGQLLAAAGVLNQRRVTFYPTIRCEIEAAGAIWVDVPMDTAVIDGKLVTGGAWPTHPDWIGKFLQVVGTRITL